MEKLTNSQGKPIIPMTGGFAYLFALRPMRGHVTMEDVRDARAVAQICRSPRRRDEIYASFGLDAIRVEQYYDIVESLNTIYERSGMFKRNTTKYRKHRPLE